MGQYRSWITKANEAYAKQMFIIETVTNPKNRYRASVWQTVEQKELELMEDEHHYRQLAQPYLDELIYRGISPWGNML